MAMPIKSLDRATMRNVARLLAADTDNFNALVRLADLDPARDFRHTDMSGTSMVGADLRGFDFSGADFRNVNLDSARIDGACFKGADLSGTNLPSARGLEAADCSFAVFQDAPFAPEMVVLPAGSFLMGSPEGEVGRRKNEGPQRQVTVGSFAIGRYPVTFAEFDKFCEAADYRTADDIGWGRGRMPVINVSWNDAVDYAAWLAKHTGKTYRLPSEAEWEFACRAGTSTAYWWGDDFIAEKAATAESGASRTTAVGSYPANPWGLFDVLGNVWEWTRDRPIDRYAGGGRDGRAQFSSGGESGSSRALRGGSWFSSQAFARCAYRNSRHPGDRNGSIGFRVSCSSPS